MKNTINRGALGCLALVLAACGGGSGNGDSGTVTPPPTSAGPTSVAVIGTVTGFGSVYVNGVRYEVDDDTVVRVEDEPEVRGDDSGLALGMKVVVRASDDDGNRTAKSIKYDDDLYGVIESVSPDANDPTIGSFTIAGLVVTVDGNTVFDDDVGNNDGDPGIGTSDLNVGMVVEVSGYPTDTGFLATRVDRDIDDDGNDPEVGRPDVDDDEFEVKGYVDELADDGTSITVNGIVFLINTATELDDGLLLNSDLIGVYVEVEADIVGGDYVAVEIEREDDFDDDDDGIDDYEDEFEIEGILQSVDTGSDPNTITINGLTVPVTDASPLESLVGLYVEIEGRFNSDDVLVIEEADQDNEDIVRLEDLVSTVNVADTSFTTRLGITIAPTGASGVEDDAADDDDDHLTPDEFVNRLQIGDRIEARGYADVEGNPVWTGVDRDETAFENDDFECELRGPVESIDGDASSFSFVIQGVTILTDMVQESDFQGDDDEVLGRAGFFDRLVEGAIVEAESFDGDAYCSDGALDAREVEFEDDD